VQSGTNVVYHAAGWLEGGLVASPEKFVMDCEVLQMIQRYMEPELWATGPEEVAVEAIREVGPGGHYFGTPHTQARYETAFYQPIASDWRNHEAWALAGGLWTHERAHRIWTEIVRDFEPPPMDAGAREALGEFVERRKREGGAPTDF
jgi:trimethylamine--corrinoid protein Co-methyltransferase